MDFGFTNEQYALGILTICLLWIAYQVNELREARKPRLKPRELQKLLGGEPITVKHDTPHSLTPDSKECYGAEKHDFECFQDFWYFADWINKLYSDLSEPIRLQELRDTGIRGSRGQESPAYGRRYDIFYNQVKIGLLEICAGLDRHFHPENKSVDVEITIDRVPPNVLPYSNVNGFLQTVASLVASTDRPKYDHLPDGETEYEYALSSIRATITELMWDMHQDNNWFPELKVRLSGTPDYYYRLLQLKQNKDTLEQTPMQEHLDALRG